MQYTDVEKQVLSLMERTDFKNLSKSDVISYASKLNELRPEVATQVLAQFPELAGLIKSSLSEYKDILEKIVSSDDESTNQVYGILNDEYLLKLRYGARETLSTLMLLYPSLDFSNKFHEDHMYPKSKFRKSYLRKQGVPEDNLDLYIETVNDIGNLQLLAAQLNEEKLTTAFDVWFAEQYKTDAEKIQYRTINMLPDMEYSYANFLQFVEQRKAKLKAELMKILL